MDHNKIMDKKAAKKRKWTTITVKPELAQAIKDSSEDLGITQSEYLINVFHDRMKAKEQANEISNLNDHLHSVNSRNRELQQKFKRMSSKPKLSEADFERINWNTKRRVLSKNPAPKEIQPSKPKKESLLH